MNSKKHSERTKEVLGYNEGYVDIHKYIDRGFDWKAFEVLRNLEDDDPLLEEYMDKVYKHREKEHHREGIEFIVNHFSDIYHEDIVRKVAELHIRDDYKGYLPSKEDFFKPEFVREHHRH